MDFTELLQQLPNCPGRNALPLAMEADGLQYDPPRLPDFVTPRFSHHPAVDRPSSPSVIVISAAGAVGKTTLARELARDRQAPLWDLSQCRAVAALAFQGILHNFGPERVSEVYRLMKSGCLFFVIDALDEARMKSKSENAFRAFVEDVAKQARGGQSIRFVLLARTQTAEDCWGWLDDAGVATSLYTVDPFDREQAKEYIEKRICRLAEERDYQGAAERIRKHKEPFAQARDLIFDHLQKAITGTHSTASSAQEAAREFLGYAPVLDAVAVLLAREPDFGRLISELQDQMKEEDTGERSPIHLLHRVVARILDRERTDKFGKNIREPLEPLAQAHKWSSWDSLFTPEEQCARLTGLILGTKPNIDVPLPSELRASYEEHINTWLREHPFLRDGRWPANVVFESYLYASTIQRNIGGLLANVQQRMSDSEYKPSRLFADFYLFFKQAGEAERVPEIRPLDVGLIYDSLLSAETDTLRIRLSLEGPDPEDESHVPGSVDVEGEIRMICSPSGEDIHAWPFRTWFHPSDRVTLRRQLKDATIVLPCCVSLGAGVPEFLIGPDVFVRCTRLEVLTQSLVVRPGPKLDPDRQSGRAADVILEAQECQSTLVDRPVTHGQLRVNWPGAKAYPWTDFYRADSLVSDRGQPLAQAYRRFRRIALKLESGGKGSLAKYKDAIESERALQGKMGEALLAKLRKDEILQLVGKHYHWVPTRASELVGISWLDLRQGNVSDKLREYLLDFVAAHKALFTK